MTMKPAIPSGFAILWPDFNKQEELSGLFPGFGKPTETMKYDPDS